MAAHLKRYFSIKCQHSPNASSPEVAAEFIDINAMIFELPLKFNFTASQNKIVKNHSVNVNKLSEIELRAIVNTESAFNSLSTLKHHTLKCYFECLEFYYSMHSYS